MRKFKIVKAALLASSLLVATSSFAAGQLWVHGSFSMENPSKSGVKKGDMIELRVQTAFDATATAAFCDVDKNIIVYRTAMRGTAYFCAYNGSVRHVHGKETY